jgi:photosystem II stability/assembly factor-like uncharacterized protein
MIASRSSHKGIQERDWRPLNAGGESGSVAPDPDDPNVVYGNNPVLREEVRSAQTQLLAPTTGLPGTWREEWTQPMAFGRDRALYTANQSVFRTRDGGKHWQRISGDLTRPHPGVPANLDEPAAHDVAAPGEARGVVYALAPSPLSANVLWAGTDDGLVQLTRDGGRTWRAVTPPGITPWSHVDAIDASHFDAQTAYVAVDRHRLDDDRPYVYVTHDGGRRWRAATNGIAPDDFVYVVREDPKRRGLLYAGTEHGVYVSFDDGAAWRSLRLNMPVVSVHDLIVKDDDLAVATHGRSFWILDDVEPLRELAAGATNGLRLFAPRDAMRLRPYNDEAEASPPETPLGENPPYGALIDYAVPPGMTGPLQLSIADANGRSVLRTWSSTDTPDTTDPNSVPYPAYWITPPVRVSSEPGMHRLAWDFHAAGSATGRRRRGGAGPLVPPGRYTVALIGGGRTVQQTLTIRRDPRIRATDADLRAQYALAREIDAQLARIQAAVKQSDEARKKPGADVAQIDALAGAPPSNDPRNSVGTPATTFTTLRWYAGALSDLYDSVESADAAPTPDQRTTWTTLRSSAERTLQRWNAVAKS